MVFIILAIEYQLNALMVLHQLIFIPLLACVFESFQQALIFFRKDVKSLSLKFSLLLEVRSYCLFFSEGMLEVEVFFL